MNVINITLNTCLQELETVKNQFEQLQTEKEDTSKKLHKFKFLISQSKHMLWVLKRTVSMRRLF